MRLRGCPTQQPAHAQACWLACWAALFLGVLTAAPMLSAPPQDTSKDKESRARLSKEELRERLQGGERVQDSIIQGDDLIAILRESTFDPTGKITIMNSVIEGGLDFTALPATAVEQVKWPRLGSDEDRERWIARTRSSGIDKIYVVANPITIAASTVLPRPQNGQSDASVAINANATFFHDITFEGATFSGGALFEGATFSGEAGFQEATFSQGATFKKWAWFVRATFKEVASFKKAILEWTAVFRGTRFAKLAFFKDAHFLERLTLERGLFETYADFRDAQINRLAFNNATSPLIINGRMDFRRATITEADLQDLVFTKDINFSDTRFGMAVEAKGAPPQERHTAGHGGPRAEQPQCPPVAPDVATVLRFVTFEGHAYFLRTAFCGRRAWNASSFTRTRTSPMRPFKTTRHRAGRGSRYPM
jgi:uncharacterized protein YjbI with pentapeptide repeats